MIRILTDSVAAIPQETAEAMNIQAIPMFLNRDGKEFTDTEVDLEKFYAEVGQMLNNLPTTSQPPMQVFIDCFEEAALAGDEVCAIFMSHYFSGTLESARQAAEEVKARYPQFKCCIVDSNSAAYEEAWPVFAAVEARDRGEDLAGCAHAAVKAVGESRSLFVPESLDYLQKGGRIGPVAALLGNVLKIAPILTVIDGNPNVKEKIRSSKKAVERMTQLFREDVEKYGLRHVMVHYIGDRAKAVNWARGSIDSIVGFEVEVTPVSPVLGLHIGPAFGIVYQCMQNVAGKLTHPNPTLSFAV